MRSLIYVDNKYKRFGSTSENGAPLILYFKKIILKIKKKKKLFVFFIKI